MPSHASSQWPQNRLAVVACLLGGSLIAISQLPIFERHVAWFWGAALLLFVGGLWSAVRSPAAKTRS